MAVNSSFHPEALFEYAEATNYYLQEASLRVAEGFITAVESAVAKLIAAPARWRVVEDPEIRRYVFTRFPFVIYYRWEPRHERVTLYAVMHCSREPGYWHHRIERNA
ncbi:MAG: type II toxin-antitoxin system RelE/ParE family toxin [Verrucomicrobiota bacterium]